MKGSHGWKSFEVNSSLHLTDQYGIHMTFSALDGVLLSRARARLRGELLGILFISKLVSSLCTELLYSKPPSSVCGPFSSSQQYTAIQQQQRLLIVRREKDLCNMQLCTACTVHALYMCVCVRKTVARSTRKFRR